MYLFDGCVNEESLSSFKRNEWTQMTNKSKFMTNLLFHIGELELIVQNLELYIQKINGTCP